MSRWEEDAAERLRRLAAQEVAPPATPTVARSTRIDSVGFSLTGPPGTCQLDVDFVFDWLVSVEVGPGWVFDLDADTAERREAVEAGLARLVRSVVDGRLVERTFKVGRLVVFRELALPPGAPKAPALWSGVPYLRHVATAQETLRYRPYPKP